MALPAVMHAPMLDIGRPPAPMPNPFSSLRVRLVATVFIAIAPAGLLMYFGNLPWMGFVMGLLALWAAWFGGERFILREVRVILEAARKLGAGNLSIRTNAPQTKGELGELARAFDRMAESLETRARSE